MFSINNYKIKNIKFERLNNSENWRIKGTLVDAFDFTEFKDPYKQKSTKGVTPDSMEWQIDHIAPKSNGGSNSNGNAQVLSRIENRLKSDK